MKVIVFGSTGTVGKHLVEQTLAEGHQVTAFCRDASKLSYLKHANLTTMEGDVFQFTDVKKAVHGHDAVCIVLGSGKSRKSTVRSVGTQNIIKAMKEEGVDRLVCQTTLGAGDSNGNLNFFWKRIMFGWFLKQVFLDHELQEDYVRASGLNWVIVRPGAFTDGAKTGEYRHGFSPQDKSTQLKISRKDVADFMVKQLSSDRYLFKTPGLSY
ncbi:NAD(P)-dependent oxidoreductase [Fulvivirga ligni]|uniref:NAD(P)-dependent oxidoreductase n=1 Tax=Fulvivirga ligni TaxID=2904246 RepID=UPI001F277CD9|nr:SDR family oxidoreductase [Fulvivirga ligni]UII21683.1 SDR family oxidoreductase [Fulvivirga ligni]